MFSVSLARGLVTAGRSTLSLVAAVAGVAALVLLGGTSGVDAADAASVASTQHVLVKPVDSAGNPADGYTVRKIDDFKNTKVDCYGYAKGVGHDVVSCYPTALYLHSCFPSRHHTVLCLRDARSTSLVRAKYSEIKRQGTAHGRPVVDLDLAAKKGVQTCSIRFGGAWGQLPTHPNWVGFYSCERGSVYGPPDGNGIDESGDPWTVKLWKSGTDHTVQTKDVAVAYTIAHA
ncbi:hypothetical protein [Nocardioides acrostichi]|uniref:Uncharacterized protein n=1 Tax=Nocardioides acrostichi TaxID=2784339 RepID=A0A930UYQ0_9ACTN|nr:hypothetical protein [Nocardioides acrostichi]MBF4163333.1 hypothetical protein [Nocardioides acrostichi]